MATKRKTNITKKPGFRLGMIASGIMIILALIVLSLWFTSKSLFDRNDHFILRNVIVRSGGWWKSRSGEVSSVLKIKPGETNLFSLDLANMRKVLEAEPSISKVSISRFLPDTLAVDIERRNNLSDVDIEKMLTKVFNGIDVQLLRPKLAWKYNRIKDRIR